MSDFLNVGLGLTPSQKEQLQLLVTDMKGYFDNAQHGMAQCEYESDPEEIKIARGLIT